VGAIISVGHIDRKFYYQCGVRTLIQQMVPHYFPKYWHKPIKLNWP